MGSGGDWRRQQRRQRRWGREFRSDGIIVLLVKIMTVNMSMNLMLVLKAEHGVRRRLAQATKAPTTVGTRIQIGWYYRFACKNNDGKYEYEFDAGLESGTWGPAATGAGNKGANDGGDANSDRMVLSFCL